MIDIDALYYLLCCLKLLILNDECLETAAKDNRGFLSYCLEKLLVPQYVSNVDWFFSFEKKRKKKKIQKTRRFVFLVFGKFWRWVTDI